MPSMEFQTDQWSCTFGGDITLLILFILLLPGILTPTASHLCMCACVQHTHMNKCVRAAVVRILPTNIWLSTWAKPMGQKVTHTVGHGKPLSCFYSHVDRPWYWWPSEWLFLDYFHYFQDMLTKCPRPKACCNTILQIFSVRSKNK